METILSYDKAFLVFPLSMSIWSVLSLWTLIVVHICWSVSRSGSYTSMQLLQHLFYAVLIHLVIIRLIYYYSILYTRWKWVHLYRFMCTFLNFIHARDRGNMLHKIIAIYSHTLWKFAQFCQFSYQTKWMCMQRRI